MSGGTKRIVFVCTGNICRSPAAHAVFESWARRQGLYIEVDSAGMGGWHTGELPDARGRKEGARRGYSLTHRARVVTLRDYEDTLLVAMDRGHHDGLLRRAPAGFDRARLVMFRAFEGGDPANAPDVDDPYYGGEREFAEMFDTIEAGMPGLLAWVTSRG